jgi:hypothetical protein
MSGWPVRLSCGVVRLWTRAYTWGLPPAARESRRDEIESDLWEWQHDGDRASGAGGAAHVLARLMLGLHDDVRWRVARAAHPKATAAGLLAITLAGMVAWAYGQYLGPQTLPPPRPMQFVSDGARIPPPPPPPPPPARPPGLD